MSVETIIRVPRGVPTGGRFTEHDRADGDIALSAGLVGLVNESFPLPQANNLEKVISVIDAVAAGANTGSAIAEALAMHDREGAYYGDAAGYLNLVDVERGVSPKTYTLTPLGEQMLGVNAADRIDVIANIVRSAPPVQAIEDLGEDGAREIISEGDLTGETVERRFQSARSWGRATFNLSALTELAGREIDECRARAVSAAERARELREIRLIASREPVIVVCPECFMQLPVSGVCGNC